MSISLRKLNLWGRSAALIAAAAIPLAAQTGKAPDAYTVTQVNSMLGAPIKQIIYRDGPKVLVDTDAGPNKANRSRILYDLDKRSALMWNPIDARQACKGAPFTDKWGDPFAGGAEMWAEISKAHGKEVGPETINGVATKLIDVPAAGDTPHTKIWVDSKWGLLMKIQMAMPGSTTLITVNEIKQVLAARPPASTFVAPASCANAPPPPLTDDEKIAAATGSNPADFAIAGLPKDKAAANTSCTVLFRVVQAKTLEPINNGFTIQLDKAITLEPAETASQGRGRRKRPASNATPTASNATPPASNATPPKGGGETVDVTAAMNNGVLRIDNVPDHFNIAIQVSNGSASSLIYRQCFAPQTVLLLAVKDIAKLGDGVDWLWVKSGKYATAPLGR